jgi:hypothetical protein
VFRSQLAAKRVSRRQREASRRVSLQFLIALAIAFAAVAAVVLPIAPRTKPVVTVYMPSDCGTCQRWMEYLAASGFRTQRGDATNWSAVRAQFALPADSLSSHTAVVDGMFIEGPVPAREIHLALAWREQFHIRGLFVPGVPRGSPGNEAFLPQPYTVFVVRDGGRIQALVQHDNW